MGKVERIVFYVGAGTCGLAAGAQAVLDALALEVHRRELIADIKKVGCMGLCEQEPMVDIKLPGSPRLSFGKIDVKALTRLLDLYVGKGIVPGEYLLGTALGEPEHTAPVEPAPGQPVATQAIANIAMRPFLAKQCRRVLANCGQIDPENLDEYIGAGGYLALRAALAHTPAWVIDEVTAAGLRGRGGAGVPAGRKWLSAVASTHPVKYIVCNADEGDPGAFMDRSLLEGDPHRVLEGLVIAGFAIGACKGYIYVRAEYPLAIARLEKAIEQMRQAGYLGEKILGADFAFDVELKMGAGAFVCGEETALLASIEGGRGIPRSKPPYPSEKGLWGCPTCINNVETLANVPDIIRYGADWFGAVGTKGSKGTKVFSLTGKVKNSGLIEVPMGVTLREIIYDLGGGIAGDRGFKAAQIGGPSGGCLPATLLDTPIDYDSLVQVGAMMGSGGLVVMDDQTCMVEVARYFLNFVRSESCGRCTPCREGTMRLCEMLERIVTPQRVIDAEAEKYPPLVRELMGLPDRIDPETFLADLEELALAIKDTAACGLGNTAPNPVLSTLKHFRHEYRAHLIDQVCPANSCRQFLVYTIAADLCKGCGLCRRECPVQAISGEKNQAHVIDAQICSRCGTCVDACPFGAISGGSPAALLAG